MWWVGLAPLSDIELVPQAVASVLNVREAPGRSPVETLANHLETRRALLIMDNFEHLVEACAVLTDALLRSCPSLRVMATSREALGVGGEVSWPVPPLSLPDPRRLLSEESLPHYESARLFRAEIASGDGRYFCSRNTRIQLRGYAAALPKRAVVGYQEPSLRDAC